MMRICDCARLIKDKDNILLLTHTRPDGDTLCSAAALCSALRRLGKNAALYNNPEITETYAPFVKDYICSCEMENAFVVSVDTADLHMLPLGFEGKVDLAIDHHASNTGYADENLVMGGKAACGEIILELIEELCGGLTQDEANLVYAAISTDTGCFCYGNTNPDTLRAAAKVIEYGAENGRLNKLLFRSMSYPRLKLEGLLYAGMRSYRDNSINVAVVTQNMMKESGATEDDCDDLASLAGKVRGSVVSITVRELPDGRSKASVRTNDQVNASEICARFGGGGHAMAAGCNGNMGPYELADALLKVVCEVME
ncbi:MAG: DHH family phosphoesterase [Oscillospiraceae bacterium]|nr:DHH family phosphoesterase [Oscillospiraceae bacterium]